MTNDQIILLARSYAGFQVAVATGNHRETFIWGNYLRRRQREFGVEVMPDIDLIISINAAEVALIANGALIRRFKR